MKEKSTVVFIYLPGKKEAVPAGRFTWDENRQEGYFMYGSKYIQRKDALPVDPVSLPLLSGTQSLKGPETKNNGFFGAIRDSMPDFWGRLVHCRILGIDSSLLSNFDLLLDSGTDRIGNLDFRDSPDAHSRDETPITLDDVVSIAKGISEFRSDRELLTEQVKKIFRHGTSMGGARPKLTVCHEGQFWLAKFPSHGDDVAVPVVEYATLELARRSGITVPDTKLVHLDDVPVLLVKRFDRPGDGSRFGFLSGLSFLQKDERERNFGYPDFAEELWRIGDRDGAMELFSRMVFNIRTHNTDDHARNIGFLVRESGITLSPAYDLVPTESTLGVGTSFGQAMTVGSSGRDSTLDNVLSDAGKFGFSRHQAMEEIGKIMSCLSGWRDVYKECGVSQRDIDRLEWTFSVGEGALGGQRPEPSLNTDSSQTKCKNHKPGF